MQPVQTSLSSTENQKTFDFQKLPCHVGVILDGNGRWAQNRNLSRSEGHRAGGETLDQLLHCFTKFEIPVVSLYLFSTENWKRPLEEIDTLWELMNEFFQKRMKKCQKLGVQIRVSGNLEKLPSKNRINLEKIIDETKSFTKLIANFCINYGSKHEILHACNSILKKRLKFYQQGKKKKATTYIDTKELESHFYTCGLPPVDLLIRTGGEKRISNFLLWQSAYAEIYLTKTLWPDFTEEELTHSLHWFESRERRFGGGSTFA